MLDINIIRNDIEKVKQAIVNKNETTSLGSFQKLDSKRKALLIECDELRNKRNVTSKEISKLRSKKEDASGLIQEMKGVSDRIKQLESETNTVSNDLDSLLIRIPNIPADDVPVGKDPTSNVIVKSWGEKKAFPFTPLPHWDLGKKLDILDFERAAKYPVPDLHCIRVQAQDWNAHSTISCWTSTHKSMGIVKCCRLIL